MILTIKNSVSCDVYFYILLMMSSNFCSYLMLKFGDLIEFLCLRIDLIRICDYWTY